MTLHASRHSRVVLVAATFVLAGATLVAQPQGRVRFDDMDLNRDGSINGADAIILQRFAVHTVTALPTN